MSVNAAMVRSSKGMRVYVHGGKGKGDGEGGETRERCAIVVDWREDLMEGWGGDGEREGEERGVEAQKGAEKENGNNEEIVRMASRMKL